MAEVFEIDLTPVWRRLLIVVVVVACAVGCAWRAGQWYLGNAIALQAFDRAGIDTGLEYAPEDSQSHFAAALFNETEAGDGTRIVSEYEKAVAASPNDYRLWTALGRGYERAGDLANGERALRRAVEVAPNYAFPRWMLGNLLLRREAERGDAAGVDAAFVELRRAAEQNESLRAQVVNLAWRFYDGDAERVGEALGASPEIQSALIGYLINRRDADSLTRAVEVWSSLEPAARENVTVQESGARLRRTLFDARRYADALAVERTLAPMLVGGEAVETAQAGRIANGGFETAIEAAGGGKGVFGWQVSPPAQTQVVIDAGQRRAGARSLRLTFNVVSAAANLNDIRQTVVVAPNTNYVLRFAFRAQEVRSASTPVIEVVELMTGDAPPNVLGTSAAIANGTSDWQSGEVRFTTRTATEAVIVRLGRAPCPDALCPLLGRVWFDDFELAVRG
ncbi:MAG: hypothetical protein MSG64_20140 [Pyrinomonadaceae bacterium MAG19_C2-C3]|nr:hypothetical protein [Pyrinomonadaceae bacterium MAG19_C2-C3]